MKRTHITVTGRVQGVGFRYSTVRQARRLGLRGWVRNTEDGKVEVIAEGDPDSIHSLVEWCHHGPTGAHITDVQHTEEPAQGQFHDFEIRY